MKKLWLLMAVLALLLCGCASKDAEEWHDFYLEEGNPDVYVYTKYGRLGLADAKKRELTEAIFQLISFEGDYAVACYTDYSATPTDMSGYLEYPTVYGVIDRKGNTVVDFIYTHINMRSDGMYRIEKDGLWGIMTIDGTIILEPQFTQIDMDEAEPLANNFARVRKDEGEGAQKTIRYGLVNKSGEIIIPVEYDDLDAHTNAGEIIVTVSIRGEISQFRLEGDQAVKIDGEAQIKPELYITDKLNHSPVLYAYAVNNLVGLADAECNAITEPVFAYLGEFKNGYAVASKFDYYGEPKDVSSVMEYPQYYGVIDMHGNTVVDFNFERAISLSDDGRIIRHAVLNDWGGWEYGYQTIEGEVIVEPRYSVAEDFANGYALVAEFDAESNNAVDLSGPSGSYYFGVIDTTGKPVIPLDYSEGSYHAADRTAVMKRESGTDYFCIINGVAETITSVGDSFALEAYYPFRGSKVAELDGEPTLEKRASAQHGHPRLDGATALFPVYAAVVQAVYPDETRYTPENNLNSDSLVTCTKTNRAYERLIDGETDIIFVAEPSDAQIAMAAEKGVEFELTPFGREAFVFIVNRENPLENISLDQIRKIYSGEITRWQDLGVEGMDEIVAYQRPKNSGSQTALEKLMGDVLLMEAPSEHVEDFMGEVLETIEYRNLPNAIGYTFRFFCTDMARSGVKLLSVDGIAPTVENIRNESYPVCSTLYMVTRKGEQNPNVQALMDWVLSDQGAELIEKSGYVALK